MIDITCKTEEIWKKKLLELFGTVGGMKDNIQ
jgi:hypothetical protein